MRLSERNQQELATGNNVEWERLFVKVLVTLENLHILLLCRHPFTEKAASARAGHRGRTTRLVAVALCRVVW